MKQIPLLQGKALLIEMPEGAKEPFVAKTYIDEDGQTYYTDPQWVEWSGTYPDSVWYLPDGNWRIIGMLSEVTEEDVVNFTESIKQHGCGKKEGYKDYNTVLDLYVDTALESLYSDIAANGYSFNTDLPKCECKPFTKEFEECPHINDSVTSCSVFEAQSRVLDHSRCLLLGREDG